MNTSDQNDQVIESFTPLTYKELTELRDYWLKAVSTLRPEGVFSYPGDVKYLEVGDDSIPKSNSP